MSTGEDGKRDFLVSFTQADRAWAIWVAWALEGAGYSVFFQDWDFKGNFILEMDKAHAQSRRTIAILSPDYLTSCFAAPEWAARLAQDARSEHDLLVPVRVRPCELEGLLAQIVFVDLVGCGEASAREKLLRRVQGIRLKPDEPPLFPGEPSHDAVFERPAFPAAAPTRGGVVTAGHLVPSARNGAPQVPWLIGAIGLAAVLVVVAVWLMASGDTTVTAIHGVAGSGAITNSEITINGGTKP